MLACRLQYTWLFFDIADDSQGTLPKRDRKLYRDKKCKSPSYYWDESRRHGPGKHAGKTGRESRAERKPSQYEQVCDRYLISKRYHGMNVSTLKQVVAGADPTGSNLNIAISPIRGTV
jgi:hypothetical protein